METSKAFVRRNLNEFLIHFKKAPHTTIGLSPAQLFIGRDIRTRLDLVRPDPVKVKIKEKQQVKFESVFCFQGCPES